MTGLLTRPIVAVVKATSSAVELRPYCAAMHSYPSACRGTINLLKQEPSAQSPWQNTILGLFCVDFILFSFHTPASTEPETEDVSLPPYAQGWLVSCRIRLVLLFIA